MMNGLDFIIGCIVGSFIAVCIYEWNIFDDIEKLVHRLGLKEKSDEKRK